jgi:riboflavin synthase
MFTGIVEEVGIIKYASEKLIVEAKKVLEDMKVGDSIAVNGVCLTVILLDRGCFSVELMPETARRTNLGKLRYGDKVNLERAVPVGGRFGGHFVQGHVDDIGKVVSVRRENQAIIMKIAFPERLMPYIVDKGFIAVDGVSLTVIDPGDTSFSVSLVGYTLEHTILGQKRSGDAVNLEVDIMGKYVERLSQRSDRVLTFEFLERYGFTKVR